jgi:hypothetical protein
MAGDGALLLLKLHGELLRALCDQADRHFEGLAAAARALRGTLSARSRRRLRTLDEVSGWVRHATRPGCSGFLAEVLQELGQRAPVGDAAGVSAEGSGGPVRAFPTGPRVVAAAEAALGVAAEGSGGPVRAFPTGPCVVAAAEAALGVAAEGSGGPVRAFPTGPRAAADDVDVLGDEEKGTAPLREWPEFDVSADLFLCETWVCKPNGNVSAPLRGHVVKGAPVNARVSLSPTAAHYPVDKHVGKYENVSAPLRGHVVKGAPVNARVSLSPMAAPLRRHRQGLSSLGECTGVGKGAPVNARSSASDIASTSPT